MSEPAPTDTEEGGEAARVEFWRRTWREWPGPVTYYEFVQAHDGTEPEWATGEWDRIELAPASSLDEAEKVLRRIAAYEGSPGDESDRAYFASLARAYFEDSPHAR